MGSPGGPDEEWFEVKNVAGRPVDVSGWQVEDKGGGIRVLLALGTTIPQSGFLLLARAGAHVDQSLAVTANFSGALPNGGDDLKLFDDRCRVVDEFDASRKWPGGDNASKRTLERDIGGNGWHTSVAPGGTPGAQNSDASTSTLSAAISITPQTDIASLASSTDTSTSITTSTTDASSTSSATSTSDTTNTIVIPPRIVIAEVRITGGAGATDHDLVRIANLAGNFASTASTASTATDISGWKLRKRTKSGSESSVKSFADGARIAPGEFFTWANSADGFAAAVGADASSTQTLSNDNSVALLDASGTVMDAVSWGSGQTTPFIEGPGFPENPGPEQALSRRIGADGSLQDTDDNSADFAIVAVVAAAPAPSP